MNKLGPALQISAEKKISPAETRTRTPSGVGLGQGIPPTEPVSRKVESIPPRVNILGVGVHATHMDQASRVILDTAKTNGKGYVCVTGVHGIMESQADDPLRIIHNRSLLTVPDGMPTVWMGRIHGHCAMDRIYGPDLMSRVCRASVAEGISHFLYGGNPGVAEALREELTRRYPGLKIAGTFTPPFRSLNENEEQTLASQIEACRPDILWVGLSTPKQERFMSDYLPRLNVSVMVGVGAAFDVHTGSIKDAPDWIKASGLQWLHRLISEPRRLWRRYAVIVPGFLLQAFLQLTGFRKYSLE